MAELASRGYCLKAGFLLFLTFLHHGIEEVERHLLVKISQENSKEKLVKLCHQSCSLALDFYTKLYTKSAVSESSIAIALGGLNLPFFIAWTIFMKIGKLVHHVYGYKALPQIFSFLPRDLVMIFQSRKNGAKSSLNFERS